jgi:hypothetical protein
MSAMLYQQVLPGSTYLSPYCKTAIHRPTQPVSRRSHSTILQVPKKATVNETTILQHHTSPPTSCPQIPGHSKIRGARPFFRDMIERDMGQPNLAYFLSTLRNAHNSATPPSPPPVGRLVNCLAGSFLQVLAPSIVGTMILFEGATFREIRRCNTQSAGKLAHFISFIAAHRCREEECTVRSKLWLQGP